MTWHYLDAQMARFSGRLIREVKLSRESADGLATAISAEVQNLTQEQKAEIQRESPVNYQARLDELIAFQAWMDLAQATPGNPAVTRAQVIAQNYICFVYLTESCFMKVARICHSGSVTKKCARFLVDGRVRSFRNAISHANWTYRADYQAIEYWARKGADDNESLEKFVVEQPELQFWQSLSRCVGYTVYSSL